MVKVAVIIPVYNVEKYLKYCFYGVSDGKILFKM